MPIMKMASMVIMVLFAFSIRLNGQTRTLYGHVIRLEDDIISKTIELRKKYKMKLPDAAIAATAVVYKLTLITHNVTDFNNIKGLLVIDSYLL